MELCMCIYIYIYEIKVVLNGISLLQPPNIYLIRHCRQMKAIKTTKLPENDRSLGKNYFKFNKEIL